MRRCLAGVTSLFMVAALLGFTSAAQAMELVPDPSVTGTVTAMDRSPIANATVELIASGTVVASTTTSADGRYGLHVADGTYVVRVNAPDASLSGVRSLATELPRNWPLDFVLLPRSSGRVIVSGDVTLSTGQPVTGGTVLFGGAGNSIASTGYFISAAAPGTSGFWSLNARSQTVNGGSLVLMASGGPSLTLTQDTYADFVIPITTTQIRVSDTSGNPLVNAPIRMNSGGFGLSRSTVDLLAEAPAFNADWTASGRTNADGVLNLYRPVLASSADVTLMVDPPSAAYLPSSMVITLPVEGGEISSSLTGRQPVVAPTPAPSPTVTSTPSPTPTQTPTPSPTPTPERITTSGLVSYSDGNKVPGAIVIPRDPNARVNGGNSADSEGRYSLTKPQGFSGNWSISCRNQASRNLQDELCFSLTGGDLKEWSSDTTVDFNVPMNFYRVRAVTEDGSPIANVKVVASVPNNSPESRASVQILEGQEPFVGSWRGFDTTGADGWAQVPGITMLNDASVNVSVAGDESSPYEARPIRIAASELADTVLVMGLKSPTISKVTPARVAPGDFVTITGSNLLATSSVTIGGVPSNFTVQDNSRISIDVSSDARSGVVEVTTPGGGAASPTSVEVLPPALSIETDSFPTGRVGAEYNFALEATGGVAPYRWRIYGSRPSGVNLTSSGQMVGTPLRTMTRSLAVAVFDATGKRVIRRIPITIEPQPLSHPAEVQAVSGRGSSQRISLSWRAPIDDGGNRITGYRIEASSDGGTSWSTVIENTRSRSTGRSFPYAAGVPTIFRVAAINALGAGPFAAGVTSPVLTAFGPPSAPQNLVVTPGSKNQLVLQWSEPANTGGTPIRGYRIRVSTNGRSWSTVIGNSRSTTTQVVLRLRADRSYFVQVAALNASGLSEYSSLSSPVQPS